MTLRITIRDGAAGKAGNGKQNKNQPKVQPNRLAYPAQSIRLRGSKFYPSPFGADAVVLTIFARYLGREVGCRNVPAVTSFGMGSGTRP